VQDDRCKQELKQAHSEKESALAAVRSCEEKAEAAAVSKAAVAARTYDWPRGSWPDCAKQGLALRRTGSQILAEDLATLIGGDVRGCQNGDCSATDRFHTSRPEDCAHACAASKKCSFWSHGQHNDDFYCILHTSEAEIATAAGFNTAPKDCAPLPTDVSLRQAVLAVLDSKWVRACDGGVVSDECPNLHDAMRTWSFAIKTLDNLLEGRDHNFATFLHQISDDSDYFVSMEGKLPNPEEMYAVAATNNRQVLDAVRSWLEESDIGAESNDVQISPLDVSVPRPARGLLCRGACM